MKKQPKVGWMFYLWISWLSLAGILIMAFTLAIHECQRLEAVEQSHWHEIIGSVSAQGSSPLDAFQEMTVTYADPHGGVATVKRLPHWDPGLAVGQQMTVMVDDRTGAARLPAYDPPISIDDWNVPIPYLVVGLIIGLFPFCFFRGLAGDRLREKNNRLREESEAARQREEQRRHKQRCVPAVVDGLPLR
jgi:hypothetical protein